MSIYVIILAGAIVRLIGLNQSLWLDEATTANVSRFSYQQILTVFSPHDFHPPLYYFFLKFWADIFGNLPISVRLPSVIFSLISAYFVYLIGKHLKNKTVGLWSAAFFIFNPLIIYYSQEARMYLMATCLLTIAVFTFLKLLSTSKTIYLIIFNLCTGLAFLTFYGTVFLTTSFYLYLLYKRRFILLLSVLPGFLIALILISPLLQQQYSSSKDQLNLVVNWSSVLGTANLKNLILIPLKFSVGKISFYPKIIYYLFAGLWSLLVFIFSFKGFLKTKNLLFLFISPLILAFVFSLISPLFQYFRFLYLLPLLSIGLAFGLNRFWLKISFLTLFIILSFIYLLIPSFHREDWQSLTQKLPQNSTVYMISSFSDPIKYYRPDIQIIDFRSSIVDNRQSVYVVAYGEFIHGFNHTATLTAAGFKLEKISNFNQVDLESWRR